MWLYHRFSNTFIAFNSNFCCFGDLWVRERGWSYRHYGCWISYCCLKSDLKAGMTRTDVAGYPRQSPVHVMDKAMERQESVRGWRTDGMKLKSRFRKFDRHHHNFAIAGREFFSLSTNGIQHYRFLSKTPEEYLEPKPEELEQL